jgi:cytochrome c biogenesis protein CcdA
MIETISPAVCGSRRRYRIALACFSAGAVAVSLALGALLGLTGALLGAERAVLAVAALALVAAAREAGLVRLPVPQLRKQVPERWRAELPLPVWSFGYGAGLGAGFVTFQPFATFWVACAAAVALARPLPAAICFAFYGVGRALMVAWPRRSGEDATEGVERLVGRRRALAGANVAALVACAALLAAPSAAAAPTNIGAGLDPSLSGGTVARTVVSAASRDILIQLPGEPSVLITNARTPSLDGDLVAYEDSLGIRVFNWRTAQEVARIDGAVYGPALDWPRIAYRLETSSDERLVLANLEAGTQKVVSTVARSDDLGRPSLQGDLLAWQRVSTSASRIFLYRISTGNRARIARSKIALLGHPSVTSSKIVWTDQRSGVIKLRKRWLSSRKVSTLWSVSTRSRAFWTTALEGRTAIVTRWKRSTGAAELIRVKF